jgi:hypothetical protein
MASLAQYLDVDGYRLDITSQLATTLTEAVTTFTLGNQTATATPGTVTASGVAQFYAITDGADIIEAEALVTGQPVIAGFSFTVQNFETAPKLIPQGHDGQGASQRIRGPRKAKDPEKSAGARLNEALDTALAPPPPPPPPAPEPEPIVAVAVEAPAPIEPAAPPPQAVVEPAPEPIITLAPVSADRLEDGRRMAEARATLVQRFLEQYSPRKVAAEAPEPEPIVEAVAAPPGYNPVQDEQDAVAVINSLLRLMGEEEIEIAA